MEADGRREKEICRYAKKEKGAHRGVEKMVQAKSPISGVFRNPNISSRTSQFKSNSKRRQDRFHESWNSQSCESGCHRGNKGCREQRALQQTFAPVSQRLSLGGFVSLAVHCGSHPPISQLIHYGKDRTFCREP
jgi:hypothetical protein